MNETNSASNKSGAYRVLARKYRPASFDDLIGQEPMVRTLTNAFDSGRIAQAFMLTGVRGVGKTTTARILARALNYLVPGKAERPTIHMPEMGEHCAAIMEGRHVDVIEMDAASHTGIDDIREITEASRYRPAIARYKVYIIDEVHMLSTQAFNGLLKTLEEPPEHVKFIFATTEIRKVPVTVLSRCQRFDLRRIDAGELGGLVRDIAAREGIEIEPSAVDMLARAGDGSARDTLSLLDQASAAGGKVTGEDVRQMLGLADRARVIDLFQAVMNGDAPAAMKTLSEQYDHGADPLVVLQELANFTHLVTRLKVSPEAETDPALSQEERERGKAFARQLSIRVLSRTWQMLLKGISETQESSRPLAAADMVLVRLAYASDLPTPDDLIRSLQESGGPSASAGPSASPPNGGGLRASAGGAPRMAASPAAAPSGTPMLSSFADVVAKAAAEREMRLKFELEQNVRLIRFEQGRIEIALTPQAHPGVAGDLAKKLQQWTNSRWIVAIGKEDGQPTIEEQRRLAKARMVTDAQADPLVAEVLSRFPGAEIVDVRVAGTADLPDLPDPAFADPEAEEADD